MLEIPHVKDVPGLEHVAQALERAVTDVPAGERPFAVGICSDDGTVIAQLELVGIEQLGAFASAMIEYAYAPVPKKARTSSFDAEFAKSVELRVLMRVR